MLLKIVLTLSNYCKLWNFAFNFCARYICKDHKGFNSKNYRWNLTMLLRFHWCCRNYCRKLLQGSLLHSDTSIVEWYEKTTRYMYWHGFAFGFPACSHSVQQIFIHVVPTMESPCLKSQLESLRRRVLNILPATTPTNFQLCLLFFSFLTRCQT